MDSVGDACISKGGMGKRELLAKDSCTALLQHQ